MQHNTHTHIYNLNIMSEYNPSTMSVLYFCSNIDSFPWVVVFVSHTHFRGSGFHTWSSFSHSLSWMPLINILWCNELLWGFRANRGSKQGGVDVAPQDGPLDLETSVFCWCLAWLVSSSFCSTLVSFLLLTDLLHL